MGHGAQGTCLLAYASYFLEFLDMQPRCDLQSLLLKLAAAEHRPFGQTNTGRNQRYYGVLEYWSIGEFNYKITLTCKWLHHSITPILHYSKYGYFLKGLARPIPLSFSLGVVRLELLVRIYYEIFPQRSGHGYDSRRVSLLCLP
jgi:hypothetical protein